MALFGAEMLEWKKEAQRKRVEAKKRCNKERVIQLHDSNRILGLLLENLKSKVAVFGNSALYVAYLPHNMILQGIAICLFDTQAGTFALNTIATHPRNITLGRGETAVVGVGKALITHIARDIDTFESPKQKVLTLQSSGSAEAFYEKLGFRRTYADQDWFDLSKEGRENLLETYADQSVMETGWKMMQNFQSLQKYFLKRNRGRAISQIKVI